MWLHRPFTEFTTWTRGSGMQKDGFICLFLLLKLRLIDFSGNVREKQYSRCQYPIQIHSHHRLKGLCSHHRVTCIYSEACTNLQASQLQLQVPGGGTQIWKWRTSAYRRTKIGDVQCSVRFRRKKGVLRCGHQKNGGHSVCKNAISWQNLQKFSVKIATKSLNFSKCAQRAQKFAIFM